MMTKHYIERLLKLFDNEILQELNAQQLKYDKDFKADYFFKYFQRHYQKHNEDFIDKLINFDRTYIKTIYK